MQATDNFNARLMPVCSFSNNEAYLNQKYNRVVRDFILDKATYDDVQKIGRALLAFNKHVVNDIVYVNREDWELLKTYIMDKERNYAEDKICIQR